jgi:hypothetical protein
VAEDQIERVLSEMAESLLAAWKGNRCLTCPLAELSAQAAAALTFYIENRGKQDVNNLPHWTMLMKK